MYTPFRCTCQCRVQATLQPEPLQNIGRDGRHMGTALLRQACTRQAQSSRAPVKQLRLLPARDALTGKRATRRCPDKTSTATPPPGRIEQKSRPEECVRRAAAAERARPVGPHRATYGSYHPSCLDCADRARRGPAPPPLSPRAQVVAVGRSFSDCRGLS